MRKHKLVCDTFNEAFKLALAINDLEFNILCLLCKNKLNIEEIAKKLRKSKIRIYQALVNLMDKKLVYREKKTLKRGYVFIYSCNELKEIQEIAIENAENLVKLLKSKSL